MIVRPVKAQSRHRGAPETRAVMRTMTDSTVRRTPTAPSAETAPGAHHGSLVTPDGDTVPTAAELVAWVRDQNDPVAWATLTERYSRLLWAIALGHGLTGDDAEDIVQTTWLRLVERIDQVREPARVGAWLAAVARRECLRTLRRRHREQPVARFPDRPAGSRTAPDPACLSAERDRLRQVTAAFQALPEHCRRLLRVLAAGQFGYAEVAAALGMPVGSVGPTRGRCLAALDRLIGPNR